MKNTTNRVVLVDDDPDFIYLVEKALSDSEPVSTLTTLLSGGELLDWLSTNKRPNIIFLDINMPGLSGLDVLESIKAIEKYKSIPVVMLSVIESQQDITRSYNIGANAYIVKPTTFADLQKLMHLLSYYWFDIAKTPESDRVG